ncbi:MAG: hypothetical protein WD270_04415 [Acetobacterales bacterium]
MVARVLVVEDEFLVGLQLEEDLRAHGCEVLGPYPTLATAIEAARVQTFDLAILDVNLRGEKVYPLADELMDRGKPAILISGYTLSDMPDRFRALPHLAKPYGPHALGQEIRRAIAGAKSGGGGK